MFKQVVFFFCVALLFLGGYQLYVTLAPAETKIKWLIEGTAEAFNQRDRETCLAAFASNYKDTSQNDEEYEDRTIDKALVTKGLDFMFANRVEADDGDFMYKAVPVMRTLAIKVESETNATARLRVNLKLKMGHTWSEVWGVDVNANLQKQGQDWVITRTALRTVMGTRPWSWE